MRIPTVTDEMLVMVLQAAASPVAVLVTSLDPESSWARKTLPFVADEFDDRIIFLSLIRDRSEAQFLKWIEIVSKHLKL